MGWWEDLGRDLGITAPPPGSFEEKREDSLRANGWTEEKIKKHRDEEQRRFDESQRRKR